MINVYKSLFGKLKGKLKLGTPRNMWESRP